MILILRFYIWNKTSCCWVIIMIIKVVHNDKIKDLFFSCHVSRLDLSAIQGVTVLTSCNNLQLNFEGSLMENENSFVWCLSWRTLWSIEKHINWSKYVCAWLLFKYRINSFLAHYICMNNVSKIILINHFYIVTLNTLNLIEVH